MYNYVIGDTCMVGGWRAQKYTSALHSWAKTSQEKHFGVPKLEMHLGLSEKRQRINRPTKGSWFKWPL